jgi:PGF-CTERM protein
MRPRLVVVLTLAVMLVVPGAAAGAQTPNAGAADAAPAGPAASADACEAVAGGEQRDNPEEDQLGYENGCWHDDPISVTVDDGLNETELDAVVARTMARVEYVRELEFEETVPVDVISREQYREQTSGAYSNVSDAANLHQDVKYEALFFVPEDEDALRQIEDNRGGSVLGYYSPTNDRIVIVSDSDGALDVDGPTLAHELAHALQDQQFDLTRYNRSTTEKDNAINGIVEGDPTYTEYLYNQRCGDEWECPSQESSPPPRPGPEFDWGIYFMGFQPYADGGAFVQQLQDEGGWAAVNDVYENPPASSEQVMYPEKYPDEKPRDVSVEDRSDDEWRVLDLETGLNYAEFGEAGMASMFISPTYDDRNPEFVSADDLQTGSDVDTLDYSLRYTDGWDGDRLYPYVTDDSVATNETGYVWKTAWDSPDDASDFASAYAEMLRYRGAEAVSDRANTYRIPDSEAYGDAFYVNHTGDTVVVVNAPTVEDLRGVRAGAAPEATPTPSPTDAPAGSTPDDEDTPSADATPSDDPDGTSPAPDETSAPGFGLVAAVVAALLAALLARRR